MLKNASQRSRDHMKRPEMEITLISPKTKEMRNQKLKRKAHKPKRNEHIRNEFNNAYIK